MGEQFLSHSPIPSVEFDDTSTQQGFTLSDVSSLKSASSGSDHSLDKISFNNNLNEVEKKLKHVGYLIEEMIETEKTYVKALTDVIDGYIKRLRKDPSSGFDEMTMKQVFVNIEQICMFHSSLYQQLLNCSSDHKLVANLFIHNIDKLATMYIEFCSAFPFSLEKLEYLHSNDPFKSALSQCQSELGHTFPVEEYLHRAVQRFLKYPLLFKDMAKKLQSLDGHAIVKEALDKLLVTAVKINSVKRVQELQAHELIGWKGDDLRLMGDLLLEDSFKVTGAKDPRILFLFKGCLLFTKKKEADGYYTFKNSVPMSNITLKEQVDNDFLKWAVLGKGSESYTMVSKDPEQKDKWTRELKRCIVYSTPGLTDIQKEALLMKLPSLKNDVEHFDKIWKKANKKSKKAKRTESVRILHNTDCDSDNFSLNSEISAAFDLDPSPVINKSNSLPSTEEVRDDIEFYSIGPVKSDVPEIPVAALESNSSISETSHDSLLPDQETVTELESLSEDPVEVDGAAQPEHELENDVASLSISEDEPAQIISEGDCDMVLSFKTELTNHTEAVVDSDLEPISDDEGPVEFKAADPALGFLNNLILNSKLYPLTVLMLIYLIACLIKFLPWYTTFPFVVVFAVFCFRRQSPRDVELCKKEE